MDKWNLFLSTNILLSDVLTILIHHFVLFFSIPSQKEKFMSNGKTILSQAALFFFVVYVGWTCFLRGSLFIKVVLQ